MRNVVNCDKASYHSYLGLLPRRAVMVVLGPPITIISYFPPGNSFASKRGGRGNKTVAIPGLFFFFFKLSFKADDLPTSNPGFRHSTLTRDGEEDEDEEEEAPMNPLRVRADKRAASDSLGAGTDSFMTSRPLGLSRRAISARISSVWK